MKKLLILGFLILITLGVVVRAQHYNEGVAVTGLIYRDYFYEQPNYGESPAQDAIVGVCMMKLDTPFMVNANKKINSVELYFQRNAIFICSNLVGHRVLIRGLVKENVSKHEHGDATIVVTKIDVMR